MSYSWLSTSKLLISQLNKNQVWKYHRIKWLFLLISRLEWKWKVLFSTSEWTEWCKNDIRIYTARITRNDEHAPSVRPNVKQIVKNAAARGALLGCTVEQPQMNATDALSPFVSPSSAIRTENIALKTSNTLVTVISVTTLCWWQNDSTRIITCFLCYISVTFLCNITYVCDFWWQIGHQHISLPTSVINIDVTERFLNLTNINPVISEVDIHIVSRLAICQHQKYQQTDSDNRADCEGRSILNWFDSSCEFTTHQI